MIAPAVKKRRANCQAEIIFAGEQWSNKISIRSFGWRDLPRLYRYRDQILSLDSALFLTHGHPLEPANLFSSLNPSYDTYTAVYTNDDGKGPLFGQIRYPLRAHSARLEFVITGEAGSLIALPALLENLAFQAGDWGALHLIGDVDEHSTVFEALRRAGFSIYAWQRIWQVAIDPQQTLPANGHSAWRVPAKTESISVRSLYQSVVPPLIHPVEPMVGSHQNCLVHQVGGEIRGYVKAIYGPRGIWLQPIIHPTVENVPELLQNLLAAIPRQNRRPVYICVRSYQAWLENALEDLRGEAGPRQAMMVKHLAMMQKVENLSPLGQLEKSRVKPSTPIVNLKSHQSK